jgi:mono/diheme cytochrome c family protein
MMPSSAFDPSPRRPRGGWIAGLSLGFASLIVVAMVYRPIFARPPALSHFADAEDAATVMRGKRVYMQHCASCHGRYLQGQPLWQLEDGSDHRRAPAHDQTGHTWMHGDEDLFFVTKYGLFPGATVTASAMPAFKDVLDDGDILAVIAFIKARWPVGLRVLQAMRNPDGKGTPAEADHTDWTFPSDCLSIARRPVIKPP